MASATPVYRAIAEELARQHVAMAFGLISEETAKLIVELERCGIRWHTTRHEAIAVGMADGYARASGSLGVVVIGRGPGLTNALSPLVSAAKGQAGIVVLVGDGDIGVLDPLRPEAVKLEEKYVDQPALLDAAGVPNVRLDSPGSARTAFARICERARSGVTIAVNLPSDLLEAEAGHDESRLALPTARQLAQAPDPAAIVEVADLLEQTWAVRRPIVLAGRGAVTSGAKPVLLELAERCGALLATSLMARALFAGEPYDLGVAGTYSSEATIELFAEADLVLAFGASLNDFTTLRGELFPKAAVVQFDADASALGRHYRADLDVLGDARLAAVALLDELARRNHSPAGYRDDDSVAARIADVRLEQTVGDVGQPGALDPRALFLSIDRALPGERALVVDSGNNWIFASGYLSVPRPEAYFSRLEYYCVGSGLGPALGVAVARPDRLTVLAVGDGGLMMTLADLDTAVRLRLPLLVLVSNDGAFGSDAHFLQWCGFPDDVARVERASFERLGQAFGAEGITIETMEDVERLGKHVQHLEGPLVVDCRVTPELRPDATDWFLAGRYAQQAAARL